jgi:hypothetical protein
MLLIAMILGLVGGLSYALGGASALTSVPWEEVVVYHTGPPWWVVTLIPIGLVGAAGGALVYWRPKIGAALLFLAVFGAVLTGLMAMQESYELDGQVYGTQILPMHPFGGPFLVFPVPLFALVTAIALAMAFLRKPRWLGKSATGQQVESSQPT